MIFLIILGWLAMAGINLRLIYNGIGQIGLSDLFFGGILAPASFFPVLLIFAPDIVIIKKNNI